MPLFARILFAIVLVVADSECATRVRFDSPPVRTYDSPSSTSYIPLEAMNPMNQPKSSSYSIVQTSSGSRGSTVTASRPSGGHHSGNNFAGRRKKKRPPRPRFRSDDEPSLYNRRVPQHRKQQTSKPFSSLPYQQKGTTAAGFSDDPAAGFGDSGDSEEGYAHGEHFDQKEDGKFVEAHNIREGKKDRHGNRKQESYEEEEKKDHDSEKLKIKTAEKGAHQNQLSRDQKHVDKKYAGRGGEKGITLKKKSGHTKTYRKSGYRRVHNKEEYKLDEEFFERGHDAKDHKQRLKEHENHAAEKADVITKNSHDSALREGQNEKKAVEEKGTLHAEKTGHKEEAKEQQQQNEHSKSDEKSQVQEDSKHGHTSADSKSRKSFFDDLF